MRVLFGLVLGLSWSSCIAPVPTHQTFVGYGFRAVVPHDSPPILAAYIWNEAVYIAPHIAEAFDLKLQKEVSIYVREPQEFRNENIMACSRPNEVYLNSRRLVDWGLARHLIAHELAHCYMFGSRFEELPYVLQEALAVWAEKHPYSVHVSRDIDQAESKGELDPSHLELSFLDVVKKPSGEQAQIYASGRILAKRIGIERLIQWVHDGGRLDQEALLALGGFGAPRV
ncbi:MAG: hypothetical protein CMJ89_07470 [Planctomycetes bacterium]|jgi:hypothetical protein|nr:hypothetical protein [Planctomycetota bacterium]